MPTPLESYTSLMRVIRERFDLMDQITRKSGITYSEAEIVAYFEHPYTNAVLEDADSVIRNVKRRARGFRNTDYFATMIYLTCGKLDLKAVTTA